MTGLGPNIENISVEKWIILMSKFIVNINVDERKILTSEIRR